MTPLLLHRCAAGRRRPRVVGPRPRAGRARQRRPGTTRPGRRSSPGTTSSSGRPSSTSNRATARARSPTTATAGCWTNTITWAATTAPSLPPSLSSVRRVSRCRGCRRRGRALGRSGTGWGWPGRSGPSGSGSRHHPGVQHPQVAAGQPAARALGRGWHLLTLDPAVHDAQARRGCATRRSVPANPPGGSRSGPSTRSRRGDRLPRIVANSSIAGRAGIERLGDQLPVDPMDPDPRCRAWTTARSPRRPPPPACRARTVPARRPDCWREALLVIGRAQRCFLGRAEQMAAARVGVPVGGEREVTARRSTARSAAGASGGREEPLMPGRAPGAEATSAVPGPDRRRCRPVVAGSPGAYERHDHEDGDDHQPAERRHGPDRTAHAGDPTGADCPGPDGGSRTIGSCRAPSPTALAPAAARPLTVAEPRALRVVQISDTHLSHRRAYAVPNVRAILAWLEAEPPDLVVHTGDITADDPDDAEEADFARQLLTAAGLPLVALPGNHDVGGFSGDRFRPTGSPATRRRWGGGRLGRRPRARGAWSAPTSTACPRTTTLRWLREALSTDRPIALFLHQPICLVDPELARRRRLVRAHAAAAAPPDALAGRPVRVVASGHLHRYRSGALCRAASPRSGRRPPPSSGPIDDGSTYGSAPSSTSSLRRDGHPPARPAPGVESCTSRTWCRRAPRPADAAAPPRRARGTTAPTRGTVG